MTETDPCPECGGTERRTTSGEMGYGTQVYCDSCGFRLANVDPRDSRHPSN